MFIGKSELLGRYNNIRNILALGKLDAVLISSSQNIFYLSNFKSLSHDEREAFVLVEPDSMTMISSALFTSQLEHVHAGLKIITDSKGMYASLRELCKNKRIGFEEHDLRMNEYEFLLKSAVSLKGISKQLLNFRSIKSSYEIEAMKEVEKITQTCLDGIIKSIRTGQTEREIAWLIEQNFRELGAEGSAFPPIVASGPNSGSPHHTCSDRVIQNGDIVLLDIGARKDEYCGDITRTCMVGGETDQYTQTYNLVKKAHDTGLSLIKPGVKFADVDLGVRKVFEDAGELEQYVHTSGHGLGVGIHEYPSISYKAEGTLEEGMVITMEPGLYYDWGGVRIEDVVVVTKDGFDTISRLD